MESNYDFERMKLAIEAGSQELPRGLNKEQIREWILEACPVFPEDFTFEKYSIITDNPWVKLLKEDQYDIKKCAEDYGVSIEKLLYGEWVCEGGGDGR